MKEQEVKEEQKKVKKLVAKKDFIFTFGKEVYEIKKGEEVKVPVMFLENLKTEKVI